MTSLEVDLFLSDRNSSTYKAVEKGQGLWNYLCSEFIAFRSFFPATLTQFAPKVGVTVFKAPNWFVVPAYVVLKHTPGQGSKPNIEVVHAKAMYQMPDMNEIGKALGFSDKDSKKAEEAINKIP